MGSKEMAAFSIRIPKTTIAQIDQFTVDQQRKSRANSIQYLLELALKAQQLQSSSTTV